MKSMFIATIISTILNFSIIILLIIFIIRSINRHLLSSNIKKIAIMTYFIILLASLLILNIIPKENFIKSDYSQLKSNYSDNSVLDDFKQLVIDGKLSSSKEYIKQGSNSFQIKGQFLKIEGGTDINEKIWVERKKEDDGKIQVINYVEKSSFHGIDITNKVLPLISHFKDDTLTIEKAIDKEMNISVFAYDITVSQFIKNKNNQNSFIVPDPYTRIILIKIPKNIQIDWIKSKIQMIN